MGGALWAAFSNLSSIQRTVVFGLMVACAIGSRLDVAPAVFVLALMHLREIPGPKHRLFAAGIVLVLVGAILVPFLILGGTEAIYFNWTFHRGSALDRHKLIVAVECWHLSPAMILVCLTGLAGVPALVKKGKWAELLLLAAGITGICMPLAPAAAYGHFATPALPLSAAAGIMALYGTGSVKGNPFRHGFWFFPLFALLYPLPETSKDGPHPELEEVAEILTQLNLGGKPVLTSVPIVAATGELAVLPGTELGLFSAMDPTQPNLARQFHMTTVPDLAQALERQTVGAVVLKKGSSVWNFSRIVPSMERQPRRTLSLFFRALRQNYKRIHRSSSMEVFVERQTPQGSLPTRSRPWDSRL